MLGATTIGNATLIAYEDGPVLATDPWLGDEHPAYFGSWVLSHKIPEAERADILAAQFVWFSHGHPDHLNPLSVQRFRQTRILVPDHVGGRIARDLAADGFSVEVLPDRTWVQLSSHIRVYCITVVSQDAILLIDVNGHLFVNVNDVMFKGDLASIRRIVRTYKHSYLLKLSGRGDSDMKNMYTEAGEFIRPALDPLVGRQLSSAASAIAARCAIPFSSFHQYQRTDSAWANEYVTPLDGYRNGFDDRRADFVPPFVHVDCVDGDIHAISPQAFSADLQPPSAFGDDWSDVLDTEDRTSLDRYVGAIARLNRYLGFVTFRVGEEPHTVRLGGPPVCGVTFEVPRASLMTAVRYEIFDDLLIGNFMKTTLHGIPSLYSPNVAALITKYADNGGAKSDEEVAHYLAEYRARVGTIAWHLGLAGSRGAHRVGRLVPRSGRVFGGLRKSYYFFRRAA